MTTAAEQQTTTVTTARVAPAGRARGRRARRWTVDRIIAELNRGA